MAMLYLVFGVFSYKQVENFIFKIAEQRNHNVEKILLNPTIEIISYGEPCINQMENIIWRHMPAFSDSNFKNGEVIDE